MKHEDGHARSCLAGFMVARCAPSPESPSQMKNLPTFLLLLATLTLTNCAHRAKLERIPMQDGMAVRVPAHRVAFALPREWRELASAPDKTLFAAAADDGHLRLVIAGPLGAKDGGRKAELVANASYQQGIQRTLQEGGYTRIERSGLVPVSGMKAFQCEAVSGDKSQSILQVHVPQGQQLWVLTFHWNRRGVSKSASVQKVLASLQVVP